MTDDNSKQVDFLLTRYGQLNDEHSSRNAVIHRTFYLSLVFVAAILGIGSRADPVLLRTILATLSAIIFTSLGLWTRTYINGRKETNRQRDEIVDELQTHEFAYLSMDGVADIFPDDENRDWWEKERVKNGFLYGYYITGVVISAVWVWWFGRTLL